MSKSNTIIWPNILKYGCVQVYKLCTSEIISYTVNMGHRGVCGVASVNISQMFATKTEEKTVIANAESGWCISASVSAFLESIFLQATR